MVAAGLARERGFSINALSLDYGQRHERELIAARRIAERLDAKRHLVLRVDLGLFGGSVLHGEGQVPKDGLTPGIPVTYVPARNLVFLTLALSWAEAIGARDIFIGVNALDYSGYPDCRPEFIEGFVEIARLATRSGVEGEKFEIHAPLQYWTKARIASESLRLGLDPADSWSCYDPQKDGRACGFCDSCRIRKKGFAEANLIDPIKYTDCLDEP